MKWEKADKDEEWAVFSGFFFLEDSNPWVYSFFGLAIFFSVFTIIEAVKHNFKIGKLNLFNVALLTSNVLWLAHLILGIYNVYVASMEIGDDDYAEAIQIWTRITWLTSAFIYLMLIQIRFKVVNQYLSRGRFVHRFFLGLTVCLWLVIGVAFLIWMVADGNRNGVHTPEIWNHLYISERVWDIYFVLIDNVLEIALIHKCLSISTQLRKMGLVEKQERNSRDRKMVNKVIKSSVWWLIFTWIWVLVFGLAQVTWFSDANSQKQMKFVLWSVGSVFATLQYTFALINMKQIRKLMEMSNRIGRSKVEDSQNNESRIG